MIEYWYNCESVRQWPWIPGFNPWSGHTKTQKMLTYATLLNNQHYKVITGKHICVVAIERELSGHPRLRSSNLLTLFQLTRSCVFYKT